MFLLSVYISKKFLYFLHAYIYLYLLYVCSYCLFTPLKNLNFLHAYIYVCVCICIFWPGREIAPNRGANATKFFTLVTKSWKLVAKLAGELKRFANINPRQTSSFKTQHVHLDRWLHAILDLGELEGCISSILVSTLWHVEDLFPNIIFEGLSGTLTATKIGLFVFKNCDQLFSNWLPLWKI